MRKKLKIDPLGWLLPLVILAFWFGSPVLFQIPDYVLPTPIQVLVRLIDFIFGTDPQKPYAGEFLHHSLASLSRVLRGFLLALLVALPLGVLTGRFIFARRVLEPLIHLLRVIPGIGWLPVAMVWFGVGKRTTVFLIALAAFFPIYLNTAVGVRQVPDKTIQAALALGAKDWDLFLRVIIPAAATTILSGIRLGLGISWAYLVLGELTGVTQGLGAVMMDARMLGNTDLILVSMILIAFWGRLCDRLLVVLIKNLHPAKEIASHD